VSIIKSSFAWRAIVLVIVFSTWEWDVCVIALFYVNTQYIVERHADTLLPQYLGMYRITINDSETYVVVVRNIFSARLTVHRKYDLKVCLADRYHLAG